MNKEKEEEKRTPGFTRAFFLPQIYQLRMAFWSDEWRGPGGMVRKRSRTNTNRLISRNPWTLFIRWRIAPRLAAGIEEEERISAERIGRGG
jgi:hypothetical protein